MGHFQCVACLHERMAPKLPLICVECGRTNTFSLMGEPETKVTAICAADMILNDVVRYETGDTELDTLLMGGFVKPSTTTAFGRGGTGKSRSCMRWATHLGTTLLVSLEMTAELSAMSARSARADLQKLHITESEYDWQGEASRLKAQCVVFDSFHYSQKQRVIKGTKIPLICYELGEWAKANEAIVFMICHSNKRNEVSGTTAVEHWPDYLMKFAKHGANEAKLTIPKARYCPTGACVINI